MNKPQDLVKQRLERIENRKKVIGTQEDRMLRKYSPSFKEIFNFFLRAYRADILTFSGSPINIKGRFDADEARFVFREFENGRYRVDQLVTRHPNIVKAVITAKKAWGLWVKEWSAGIADGVFTKAEIWDVFTAAGIGIPLQGEYSDWVSFPEYTQGFNQYMPKAFFIEFQNAVVRARTLEKEKSNAEFRLAIWQTRMRKST